MTKSKSLDERIAAALKPDAEISSVELGQLLDEVEAAAKAADETASKAHREALDPSKIVDTKTVGAAVATAALTRDRLQAALPPLTERCKQAAEREILHRLGGEARRGRDAVRRTGAETA
jgi:hypothetical protein